MGLEIFVVFAAFGAMLSWAVGDFLIQKTTRKIGSIESLAFIGIIGSIALIPFVINDLHLLFSWTNLILLIILGALTFVAAFFDFEALKLAKLSTADTIMELELPVTILLAFIFFNESLTGLQWGIIALIFVGILLIATESIKNWKLNLERGVLIAVLAAIGMGLINFLTSASSRTVSPLMAVWIPWIIYTIFCLVLIWKKGEFPKFIKNASRFKWLILWMGLVDTAAWICYSFAVFKENIGVVTAITECYPAVAVFLGVWFNKEKNSWHQYFGAALAIIASIALALLS